MLLILKLGQEMVRMMALCRGDVWRSPEKRPGGTAKTGSPGLVGWQQGNGFALEIGGKGVKGP